MVKNYYKILEVREHATGVEIKRAYRSLAKKYHPDKSSAVHAAQLFAEINEAYEVLSDPDQKQSYDQRRMGGQQPQTYRRRPAYRPRQAYQRRSGNPQIDLRPYVFYFKTVSLVGLVVSLLLTIDFLLPRKVITERIVKIENIVARNRNSGGRIIAKKVITTNETYHIGDVFPTGLYKNQEVSIRKTMILNIATLVDFGTDQDDSKYAMEASIYRNFSFAWIILLITSALGTFLKTSPETILNLAIVSGILLLLVIYFTAIS